MLLQAAEISLRRLGERHDGAPQRVGLCAVCRTGDQRPAAVNNAGVDLVAQELSLASVKNTRELLTRVVRVGHEGDKDHSGHTGTQVHGGSVEGIVDKDVVLKEDNLELARNRTNTAYNEGRPGFNGSGTRTRGDLERELANVYHWVSRNKHKEA